MKTTTSLRAPLLVYRHCMRKYQIILASLLVLFLHGVSFAHVQKTAVTRILFNSNTQNIEVMHRFLVHDAEHAASLIFGQRQTLMESAESRELFSSYVRNRFAIEAKYGSSDLRLLELEYVGAEIDGQFLWVYQEITQEAAEAANISALSIVDSALRDIWPDQENLVNIEKSDQIYTLNFGGSDDKLTIEL